MKSAAGCGERAAVAATVSSQHVLKVVDNVVKRDIFLIVIH